MVSKDITLPVPDTLPVPFSSPVFYLINIGFLTPKPPVCLEALGMQNKQIPDSAITASSESYGTKASYGRLHFLCRSGSDVGGWVARLNDQNPFFQVNFGNWTKVTRVATQGRQDQDQWVKSFSLSYGYDALFFRNYTEKGENKVSKRMTNERLVQLCLKCCA